MDNQIQGRAGYPLYDDGSPVITHTLKTKLKPLELYLYSSPGLARTLYERLYPDLGDSQYDSWGLDDFVAYGLEQAAKHSWMDSPGAVVYWCRRELWKRKKRARRYELRSEVDTEIIWEYPSNRVPEDIHQWLVLQVPSDVARVFITAAEQDISLSKAAELLGVDSERVYRYTAKLRKVVQNDQRRN